MKSFKSYEYVLNERILGRLGAVFNGNLVDGQKPATHHGS